MSVWIFLETMAADTMRQFFLRDARLMHQILETVAAGCAMV